MDSTARGCGWVQRALPYCGAIASLLYFGMDRLAGRVMPGYDFMSQSMSDLSAVGTSARPLVVSINMLATMLIIAFGIGIGVWRMADRAFLPRATAGLVIGQALAGLSMIVFFPTQFGERPDASSTSVVIGALGVMLLVLAIGFGAAAFRGWFRVLSIGILLTYALLAFLRFATVARSPVEAAVSLVGAQERTMFYIFLLWVLALTVYCLRSNVKSNPIGGIGVRQAHRAD